MTRSPVQNALAFGLNSVMAALLGMLTGIGGGMTRDVLLAEIRVARRSLRRCRPGRRGRGRDRRRVAAPGDRGDSAPDANEPTLRLKFGRLSC